VGLKVLKVLKDNIKGVCISSEESEGYIGTQLWYLYKGFKGLVFLYALPFIFLYPSEASEGSGISSAIKKRR
jgi:hypothetical protein